MTETTYGHAPGSRHAAAASAAEQATPHHSQVAAHQSSLIMAEPDIIPVPVRGVTRQALPPLGVWRTMLVQPGQFRQLLPMNPTRSRSILVAAPMVQNAGLSYQTGAKVTPTVSHQAIATIPTPVSGIYTATVLCYVDGTTTAADEDNMELSWNGCAQVVNMLTPVNVGAGVAPIPTLNGPYRVGGINGANSMIVRTSGVPSGTAVYHALVVLTPVTPISGGQLIVCDNQDLASSPGNSGVIPDGFALPLGIPVEVRNLDGAWVYNAGGAAATLAVLTESYENAEPYGQR